MLLFHRSNYHCYYSSELLTSIVIILAEFAIGRVCYVPSLNGPSLLCVELVMCRVDPIPYRFF